MSGRQWARKQTIEAVPIKMYIEYEEIKKKLIMSWLVVKFNVKCSEKSETKEVYIIYCWDENLHWCTLSSTEILTAYNTLKLLFWDRDKIIFIFNSNRKVHPREQLFVTESGCEVFDQLFELYFRQLHILDPSMRPLTPHRISMSQLVSDAINLLIGVPSHTFILDQVGNHAAIFSTLHRIKSAKVF